MSLHEDLFTFLKEDPDISALVSGRIFHEFIPQGEPFPAMTFQLVTGQEVEQDMDYPDDEPPLEEDRYQFDIYSDKSAEAVAIAKKFDKKLRSLRGVVGTTTIQRVERIDKSHLGEVQGDKVRRRISSDYSFWYED